MIIRSMLPTSEFTRIDRRVFAIPNLSDGAKVLYGYLAGLRSGQNFSDTYVMKVLNVSKNTLAKRKKELKDARLILSEKIGSRVHVLYVGHTKLSAYKVKEVWELHEEDDLAAEYVDVKKMEMKDYGPDSM